MSPPAKSEATTPLLSTPDVKGTQDLLSSSPSGQSLVTMSGTRECANCREECQLATMMPWGRDGMCCHSCKNNYNRRSERNRKDPLQKADWKAKSKDQKTEWFRENKRTRAANNGNSKVSRKLKAPLVEAWVVL